MAVSCSSGDPQCIRVSRMPLATNALLYKQTIGNFRTHPSPWRHLSGNRVLFVPHSNTRKVSVAVMGAIDGQN